MQLLTICTSLKVRTVGLNLDISKKVFNFSPGASPFVLSQAQHPLFDYDNNNGCGVRVWGLYSLSVRGDRGMLDVNLF